MTQKKTKTRIKYKRANAGMCPKCYQVIVSKSRHDFVSCHCGNHFVDGGDVYERQTVGLLPLELYWRTKGTNGDQI